MREYNFIDYKGNYCFVNTVEKYIFVNERKVYYRAEHLKEYIVPICPMVCDDCIILVDYDRGIEIDYFNEKTVHLKEVRGIQYCCCIGTYVIFISGKYVYIVDVNSGDLLKKFTHSDNMKTCVNDEICILARMKNNKTYLFSTNYCNGEILDNYPLIDSPIFKVKKCEDMLICFTFNAIYEYNLSNKKSVKYDLISHHGKYAKYLKALDIQFDNEKTMTYYSDKELFERYGVCGLLFYANEDNMNQENKVIADNIIDICNRELNEKNLTELKQYIKNITKTK